MTNKIKHDIKEIASNFLIPGDFISAAPYGSGHINDTYAACFCQGGINVRYIIQRINHNVFKNPPALMENIMRVTEHLRSKLNASACPSRQALRLITTHDYKPYHHDAAGNYWRVYIFVEGANTYDVIKTPEQTYQAGKAFGDFQKNLVDIPGGRLHETIPDFHNTPKRMEALEKAIEKDVVNRAAGIKKEIDFALNHKNITDVLIKLNQAGKIPERITHNDTKINNVMLDDTTGEGVCVIDLDTVMPGLVHYDFGDLVRTSTSPAAEDEKDLSKVTMRMPMFESLLKGYMKTAGDFLNPTEREYLPFSGKLITFEIGIRFLTDYLSGDVYFKTHRDGHNLDRCRTQFKLVESIEEQENKMTAILKNL